MNNIFQTRKNNLYSFIASDITRLKLIIDLVGTINFRDSFVVVDYLFWNDDRFLDYFIMDFIYLHNSSTKFANIYFKHKKNMRDIETGKIINLIIIFYV